MMQACKHDCVSLCVICGNLSSALTYFPLIVCSFCCCFCFCFYLWWVNKSVTTAWMHREVRPTVATIDAQAIRAIAITILNTCDNLKTDTKQICWDYRLLSRIPCQAEGIHSLHFIKLSVRDVIDRHIP